MNIKFPPPDKKSPYFNLIKEWKREEKQKIIKIQNFLTEAYLSNERETKRQETTEPHL